jgi:uncharacterized protein (DUF885 family)
MRVILFSSVALLALGSIAACSPEKPVAVVATPSAADIKAESEKLSKFLDVKYEESLQLSPESLTGLGRKDQYDKLDDRTDSAGDKELAWRRATVEEMKKTFDPAKLDEEARTSFDVWVNQFDQDELSTKWRRHQYLASQLGGVHTGIPQFLITQHRVDEKSDMEAYISRVGLIATALDQSLEQASASAKMGVHMPRFVYAKAQTEAAALIAGAPFGPGKDSALFADGKTKIAALVTSKKITSAEAKTLTDALTKAMTEKMKPGYERFIAWLKADEPNSTLEAKGAGSLPDGAAYYNAALKLQTTTDMTADEIHQLGLSEVARIQKEMEAIKDKVGFKGTLQDFFKDVRTNKKFYLPNTDAGRAEYLKRADDDLKAVKAKLPEYFGKLPKADLVVKRVEPFREVAGGAQHYFAGTPDGSRPGIYYVHEKDMSAMATYQIADIAYHEGLPGHHMQISIAQELTGVPQFRTQVFYTAYTEGWGLYAESLAKEMGFYTDPYDDFGRLSGEIWRAIRLVIDTGIHSKGWTEEQAVKYFVENSAQPETAIRSEVKRYITSPGQATCYKIGMIKFQTLRDKARKELGAKFSYPKFHDTVLGGGALPLPVLEARVDRFIAREKAGG